VHKHTEGFLLNRGRIRISEDFNNVSRLSLCEKLLSFPEHAKCAAEIDVGDVPKAKKVCMFGVGESSIAGDLITAYADDCSKIPVFNHSSYIVPGWVDNETDVILVSFSGNNAVINSIYNEVKDRGCRIYCIVNNGKLKDSCENDGYKVFIIPDGLTSRSSLGFELGIMASLIEKMGVCDIRKKLLEIIPVIRTYRDSLFSDERVHDLKFKLHDNTVAIYGTSDFRASYKRWKMSINEDLGSPSYCGELPEFNHNEIVGWANHNQDDGDLRIVMLRGNHKSEVLMEIIDKTMEVLEESDRHVIDIIIPGDDSVERNMRAIILADYISQLMKYEGKSPMTWGGTI